MTVSTALVLPADPLDDLAVSPDGSADHRPVAVIAWPSVPVEIVRAAGMRPVVMRGSAAPTPLADAYLEANVFPSRLRQLVEAALDGRLADAACVVIPRTSDADYKAFLYLRELIRREELPASLPVLLFDLLQSNGAHVRDYNVARTRALFETLQSIADRRASLDDVRAAIQRANAARGVVRRLLALRAGTPLVKGMEMLPLVGAVWRLNPENYVELASEAAEVLACRAPLDGPRVLLTGAPFDGHALHAIIESLGGIVVSEVGPWGSGAAGEDIARDSDPIASLADAYHDRPCSPRTSMNDARHLSDEMLDDVDAAVVVLPPDDSTFGWDYPGLRRHFDARGLPHACVLSDANQPIAAEDRSRLAILMGSVASRLETSGG